MKSPWIALVLLVGLCGCDLAKQPPPPPLSSPPILRAAEPVLDTPPFPAPQRKREPFRMIGYLPDYRIDGLEADALDWLTDLIIFSVEVRGDGTLDWERLPPSRWKKIAALRDRRQSAPPLRVHLCVGGWERSRGFSATAANPAAHETIARELIAACAQHQLAGVDLDWEHPSSTEDRQHFAEMLTTLSRRLAEKHLELSIAVAPSQDLPEAAWQAVNRVHSMSYDGTGKHSTLESATKDITRFQQLGIARPALVLGLPFYGRNEKKRSEALTFAEIQARFSPPADTDETHGFYFNGRNTIRRKTRLAVEEGLGGVMIWEIAQDAKGSDSLRKVISDSLSPEN